MNLDARGPEEIRAAFSAAITTITEHAEDVSGVGTVLTEATDRYESLEMAPTTLAHLRDAAGQYSSAHSALQTAHELLEAAMTDFDARDGQVAETVAGAGNLASAELLTGDDQAASAGASAAVTGGSTAPQPKQPYYQVVMFAGDPFGTCCWVALEECLDQEDVRHRKVWRVSMGADTNFWADAEAAVNGGEPLAAVETVDPDWFFDGDTDWEVLAIYDPQDPDEPRDVTRHLMGGLGERGTPVADGLELFYLGGRTR